MPRKRTITTTVSSPFRKRGWALAGALLLALILAACSGAAAPSSQKAAADSAATPTVPLPALDAGQVELGQQVYTKNCAACHGPNGEGEPDWKIPKEDGTYPAPPHSVDGHTWHHGDDLLFQIIEGGGDSLDIPNFKSNMPAFGGILTDEEIVAVLAYLKSTWPEEQRRYQFEASQLESLLEQ